MIDSLNYDKDDAFHGILGDFAKHSAEHMEIDHFTLYVHLLVSMGNLIGRRRACWGGDSLHYPNLFAVIVADSAQGKGCVASRAERFAERVDPSFRSRLHHDVQSAQALIRLVTDEQTRPAKKGRGTASELTQVVEVPAVVDKRCLLSQGEMQSIFTAKSRVGCTLGPVLKLAWDGVTLENNTKEWSMRATNPHISLIGSITPSELHQAIAASKIDLTNGFFNRFLFVRAETMRLLPNGGDRSVPADMVEHLQKTLNSLGPVVPAPEPLIMEFDREVEREWAAFYEAYRDAHHPFFVGLNGFRERVAQNAMRIAMISATLAGKTSIGLEEFRSARAAALRCQDHARGLVGPAGLSAPSPVAKIASKLEAAFLGQDMPFDINAVWQSLHRHGKKEDVHAGIDQLLQAGTWQRCSVDGKDSYVVTPPKGETDNHFSPAIPNPVAAEPDCSPSPAASNEIVVDGHRVRRGDPLVVEHQIGCYTPEDKPTAVNAGTVCYLAQCPLDATEDEIAWLKRQAAKKSAQRLVITQDGELLYMPKKPANEWVQNAYNCDAPEDRAATVADYEQPTWAA